MPSPKARKRDPKALKKSLQRVAEHFSAHAWQPAYEITRELVKTHPDQPAVHKLHGQALVKLNRFNQARPHLEIALKQEPHNPALLVAMAQCEVTSGELENAMARLDKVLKHHPERIDAWSEKGNVALRLRRVEDAEHSYRQALALDPDSAVNHYNLSQFVTYQPDDDMFPRLVARMKASDTPAKEKMFALFTLGKGHLDCGNDDLAFDYFRLANGYAQKLMGKVGLPADVRLKFIRQHFTPELYERLAPAAHSAIPQVFIVGMSRSGKSLVEGLFTGIPGIEREGESRALHDFVSQRLKPLKGNMNAYLEQMDIPTCQQDAERYLQHIGGEEPVKITTIPDDIWNLGLIGLWFPKVPIILCVRDVLDQGVSSYFNYYQEGHQYTYDLHELGRHVACYEKAMEHWANVLPNPIFLIDYQELTTQPDTVATNLLHSLGLERSTAYEQEVQAHAHYADTLSPTRSLDVAMPIRSDFNGFGHRFVERLGPMVKGYQEIVLDFS